MLMSRLLVGTALSVALSTTANGATIPFGASSGDAAYFAASATLPGCPCGDTVEVAGDPNNTSQMSGTWTMNAGQTWDLVSSPGSPDGGPFLEIGRSIGKTGTVTLDGMDPGTGNPTALTMTGNDAPPGVQVGRRGGTGTFTIQNGASLTLSDPANTTPSGMANIGVGASGGTGTLNVDAASVLVESTNGALIKAGNGDQGSTIAGGTGTINITNGSTVTIRDLNNNVPNTGNPSQEGAWFVVGGAAGTSGTATVDNSVLNINGEDSQALLQLGQQANTTGKMTISNGSVVTIAGNSGGTTKATGYNVQSDLIVGQGNGSNALLNVNGASTITETGAYGFVGIGYAEGSFGNMDMSGGSSFSYSGPDGLVQIGQGNPTAADGGVGKLTLSDSGTKFDTTTQIHIGQDSGIGSSTGILTARNGAEVTASEIDVNAGGTLKGNGTFNAPVVLNAGGIIAPDPVATPGTMTIIGDLTANSGGLLKFLVGGTSLGQYDQLNVTGNLFATTPIDIELSLINGFVPQIGDTFDFLFVKGTTNLANNPFNLHFEGYASSDFQLISSNGQFSLKTVALAPVPLPASLPLLVFGLAGFGFLAKKKAVRT